MKIYLAGPMRGIKDFNFPAFHAAAKRLREKGHEVFNPAEHDEFRHGVGFNLSKTGDFKDLQGSGFDLRRTLKYDLCWICDNADFIALLPGWQLSSGSTAEWGLGIALGLEFIHLA